jgi:hypothetical protein
MRFDFQRFVLCLACLGSGLLQPVDTVAQNSNNEGFEKKQPPTIVRLDKAMLKRNLIGYDHDIHSELPQDFGRSSLVSFNRRGGSWYLRYRDGKLNLVCFDGEAITAQHEINSDRGIVDFSSATTDLISSTPAVWPFEYYTTPKAHLSVGTRHFFVLYNRVICYDGSKWNDYWPYLKEVELYKRDGQKYRDASVGLAYCKPIGLVWNLAVSPDGTKAIASDSLYLHFFDGEKWDVKPFPLYVPAAPVYDDQGVLTYQMTGVASFGHNLAFAVDNSGCIYMHSATVRNTGVVAFDWDMDFDNSFEDQFQFWLKKMQSDSAVDRERAVWAMSTFRETVMDRIKKTIETSDNEELNFRLNTVLELMNRRGEIPMKPGYYPGVIDETIFSDTKTMTMDRKGTLQLRVGFALVGNKWIKDQIIRRKADGTTSIEPASKLVDPRPEGYRDYKIVASSDDGRMILNGKAGRFLYTPSSEESNDANEREVDHEADLDEK